MAHSLTTSLTNHQKADRRRPGLTVTASTQRAGIDLLRWSRWYTGAEADAPNAVAVPSDGSLLRIRNDAGTIKTSRVAAPTSGSTFSSWTSTATGASGSAVAIAATGSAAIFLYVLASGLAIGWYYSTNNGATWTNGGTLVTEASAIGSVALAFRSNGSACAFYTLGTTTTLKRLRRSTGGTWDASGTTWSKTASVASLTGVAASCASGDYAVVLTGTEVTTTTRKTWMTTLGNGGGGFPTNTWFGLSTITQADSLSTVSYSAPAAAYIHADVHGFTTIKETGNVAFTRSYYSHSGAGFAAGLGTWMEPYPFEAIGAFGIGLATYGTEVFATSPSGVWHATIGQTSDVSARVRSCSWEHTPTGAALTLELANNDAGHAALIGLVAGGELTLTPGYYSGTGGAFEGYYPVVFAVDTVALQVRNGIGSIIVKGSGPWERADRWHAPQAVQYAGTQTRDQLFSGLALRAEAAAIDDGGTHPPSSDFTGYSPQFAIASGESAATSLRRLLAVVTDYCVPDGVAIRVRSTSASDTVDWTLGAAAHPYTALALLEEAQRRNWVRVQGPDRYADAVTGADEYQYGGTIRVLRDLDASTDVKALAWAANAARRDHIEQEHGSVTMPFHAGLELLDVVSLASPELGLTATSYRVIRLGTTYTRDAKAPRFDTTITLGGL